jgi:hypothetical protein
MVDPCAPVNTHAPCSLVAAVFPSLPRCARASSKARPRLLCNLRYGPSGEGSEGAGGARFQSTPPTSWLSSARSGVPNHTCLGSSPLPGRCSFNRVVRWFRSLNSLHHRLRSDRPPAIAGSGPGRCWIGGPAVAGSGARPLLDRGPGHCWIRRPGSCLSGSRGGGRISQGDASS